MTTSIRDLLDQVRQAQQAAQNRPPEPELADQARQVIAAAAGSLRLLQEHWRPDWSQDQPATQLVARLAEACSTVQSSTSDPDLGKHMPDHDGQHPSDPDREKHMADHDGRHPGDTHPIEFLRALLRIKPEDAEQVRENSPPTRRRTPQEGPYHDYGDDQPRAPLCRPAQLAAITGDAVTALCGQSNTAPDRWAIATAVADVVTHAATAHRIHHPGPNEQVEAARQAAMAILRLGRRYVAGRSSGILDIPITPPPGTIADPLQRAAVAAAVIERTLALAATDHTRPAVTVYELRALSLAFKSTTELISTRLDRPAKPAAQAWEHLRQLSRRMRDGFEPAPDGPERLIRNCAQLHNGFLRLPHHTPNPHDTATLQEILGRIASSAKLLASQANRLAGQVYAPARDYPVRETRVGELLRQQAIVLDTEDITVLVEALQTAETATAALIKPPAASMGLGYYPILSPGPPQLSPLPPSIDPPTI